MGQEDKPDKKSKKEKEGKEEEKKSKKDKKDKDEEKKSRKEKEEKEEDKKEKKEKKERSRSRTILWDDHPLDLRGLDVFESILYIYIVSNSFLLLLVRHLLLEAMHLFLVASCFK